MTRFLFLLLIFQFSNPDHVCSSNNTEPRRIRKEVITVRDSILGFRREIVEENFTNPQGNYWIPYTSLESVHKIDIIYLREGGKPSHRKVSSIQDVQIPSSAFYTCLRAKSIHLEQNAAFRIGYFTECSDLFLLSALNFTGSMPVDTFYYELRVPAGYHLAYNIPFPEMLSFFRIDTLTDRKYNRYIFTGVPKIKYKNSLLPQADDKTIRQKACEARIIITPSQYYGRESEYFNDCLQSKFSGSQHLNDTSKILIDSITRGCYSTDSLTTILSSFIRKKIKYLDIEVGMGAFVPDNPDNVLKERQGDCKGMSNLLCQALRSKGVEAYLGITATIIHRNDMNFPSLSSADHMICVVKTGDKWLFLDPTDKLSDLGRVSCGIQGRSVFVIGYQRGVYLTVPMEPSSRNADSFYFDLTIQDNRVSGKMTYSGTGGPGDILQNACLSVPFSQRELLLNEVIRGWVASSVPSESSLNQYGDSLRICCNILLSPSIFVTTPAISYLSLAFLPKPMHRLQQAQAGCDVITGHTIMRTVTVRIDFGADISSLKFPLNSYNDDLFSFEFTGYQKKNIAEVRYIFRYEKNVIPENEFQQFKNFDSFIDKTLQQVIECRK